MVRYLGTSDDVTTCDCCGRKDLKKTVALSIDEGEAVHYGVNCAARALKTPAKVVRSETKKVDDAKEAALYAEREAARKAETAVWFAFLSKRGQGGDVFSQIVSLGGYATARKLFNEDRDQAGAA